MILTTADDGFRTSARNRLAGTVAVIRSGPVNSEVHSRPGRWQGHYRRDHHESVLALDFSVGARAAAADQGSPRHPRCGVRFSISQPKKETNQ